MSASQRAPSASHMSMGIISMSVLVSAPKSRRFVVKLRSDPKVQCGGDWVGDQTQWALGPSETTGRLMAGCQYAGAPEWAGATRVPFSVLNATLEPALLNYLQRSLATSLSRQLLRGGGGSGGRVPGHNVKQIFLHGLSSPRSTLSASMGGIVRKHSAPASLRALLESLRRQLSPRLLSALHTSDADGEFARLLRVLIKDGRLFADVNVQFHSGAHVTLPDVYWHVDKPNSALHLGISLFGRRWLHSRCGRGCNVSRTVQAAGAVYLSSPAAFEHGVEYLPHAGGSLARSIVAVQARLLMPNDSMVRQLDEARGSGGRPRPGAVDAFTRLASALRHGPPLELPTLAELRSVEASLPGAAAARPLHRHERRRGASSENLAKDGLWAPITAPITAAMAAMTRSLLPTAMIRADAARRDSWSRRRTLVGAEGAHG